MDISIQPLPGHPLSINVQAAIRSTQEVLDSSFVTQTCSGTTNLQLAHPPVCIIQEGGGEKTVNKDSVIAQLNLSKKNKKKQVKVPKTLVVWLIDLRQIDRQLAMVIQFLLGPIQRLFYEKKDGDDILLWRQAISQVLEDPILQECLENTLFDGEPLSAKHYVLLLRAAKLGGSSIDQELGRQRAASSTTPLEDKQEPSSTLPLDTAKSPTADVKNIAEQQQTDIAATADAPWPRTEETEPFDMILNNVIDRAIQAIEGDL